MTKCKCVEEDKAPCRKCCLKGPKGPQGPSGCRGEKGKPGEPGPQGPQGCRGKKGKEGPKGSRGCPGKKGKPGKQGPKGPRGCPGKKGKRGKQGQTECLPSYLFGLENPPLRGQIFFDLEEASDDIVMLISNISCHGTDTLCCNRSMKSKDIIRLMDLSDYKHQDYYVKESSISGETGSDGGSTTSVSLLGVCPFANVPLQNHKYCIQNLGPMTPNGSGYTVTPFPFQDDLPILGRIGFLTQGNQYYIFLDLVDGFGTPNIDLSLVVVGDTIRIRSNIDPVVFTVLSVSASGNQIAFEVDRARPPEFNTFTKVFLKTCCKSPELGPTGPP